MENHTTYQPSQFTDMPTYRLTITRYCQSGEHKGIPTMEYDLDYDSHDSAIVSIKQMAIYHPQVRIAVKILMGALVDENEFIYMLHHYGVRTYSGKQQLIDVKSVKFIPTKNRINVNPLAQ